MIELRRDKSSIEMSLTIWTFSLELARIAGWIPAGTRKHDPAGGSSVDPLQGFRHLINWQNEYRFSDGQVVCETDARLMGESLATVAVAGERILQDWSTTAGRIPGIRTQAKDFNWFTTPEGKQHLRNLADFCRGGAFQIC
jgi:hypothetical protein